MIAVVLAGDDRFLPGLLVALWSLRERAGWGPSTHDLHLYELGAGITDKRRVEDVWMPTWHKMTELRNRAYRVDRSKPVFDVMAHVKLGVLGVELAPRCIWVDADTLAMGSLPLLDRDGWALPHDFGIVGQVMDGDRPAFSTGVLTYTPDHDLPRKLEEFSHRSATPYQFGDQGLLSGYINAGHLGADVLPQSHHLNVRWGQAVDYRSTYLAERQGARLLHYVGPKPWLRPRECFEVETWLDAARLAGVQLKSRP